MPAGPAGPGTGDTEVCRIKNGFMPDQNRGARLTGNQERGTSVSRGGPEKSSCVDRLNRKNGGSRKEYCLEKGEEPNQGES